MPLLPTGNCSVIISNKCIHFLFSQLRGSFLFSSSDALLNSQPPMALIIGGCHPAVCVDARHLMSRLQVLLRWRMSLELAFPTPFLPMVLLHSVESHPTLALKSTSRILVLLTFLGVLISINCQSVDTDDGG